MKRISIRLKLTLWFSSVLIVMSAAAIWGILHINSRVDINRLTSLLIQEVDLSLSEIVYAKEPQGGPIGSYWLYYGGGYIALNESLLVTQNEVRLAMYSLDGSLLYGENPISSVTDSSGFSDATLTSHPYEGSVYYSYDRLLSVDGLDSIWIRGVVSSYAEDFQLSMTIRAVMLSLPMFVVVAVVGGYLIAGQVLRPIKKISDAASGIEQGGDLKKRIELGEGKDELHSLASSINSMISRLDRAFETEKQFASDASHELRTPISVILAQCEYSLEKTRTETEYIEAMEVIRRQSDKMAGIISDMLDFTRLETTPERYIMEGLELSELVSLSCLDFEHLSDSDKKGIKLVSDIQPGIRVYGSYQLLTRLVTNLISNAFRYGKEGGNVWVELRAADNKAFLSVRDDGIGISSEHQPRVFDRFYQVDSSRSGEGTGLGLAISKEIAKLHGGDIELKSSLGEGSEFIFWMKLFV